MKPLCLIVALLGLVPAACERPGAPGTAVMLLEAAPIREKPAAKADLEALIHSNTALALDLYRGLSAGPHNVLFSPYSISAALAMTYAGARGATAAQIARAMHFDLEPDKLHAAFQSLNGQLLTERPGAQLHSANALWGQKGMVFVPEFMQRLQESYGAGLGTVDFVSHRPEALGTINGWVGRQTNGMIPELLQPSALDESTRLVLCNALYFRADWAHPFTKEGTWPAPFTLSGGDKVKVSMMHKAGHFRCMQGAGFNALELPYQNRFALVVLLPDKVDGLQELEQSLTAGSLQECLGHLGSEEVDVTLPRFEVQGRFSLRDELKTLGMTTVFSPHADLSGVTTQEKLCLKDVIHQSVMKLDEKGTEAAAATAVLAVKSEARKNRPRQFQADHPFLFLIRDTPTGAILFLGRLADPRGK
jgi:serpin B